jgi:hypothetical protein
MPLSDWMRKLFGRSYQPASPPQPNLTPEQDEQRREQIATEPDDPKLTPSVVGDGAG